MAEIESLVLEHLRAIRTDMAVLRVDTREIRERVAQIETELGRLIRDRGEDIESRAHLQARMDRLSDRVERVERVERRLDLREEPA